MKISANEESEFTAVEKKVIKSFSITFRRFGKKGGKYTKERFWITSHNNITGDIQTLKALKLEDLINIVSQAKKLIKQADSKIK
ncbi:hypothetical protein [Chryseobacterium indoltheticum]|uniref:Uncharacterized protein n=1 Tax=Chryseobacterium indoltheticum TaxID=254 RepID=A0A381FHH8_9FLAO|nr:hypothetical protein [Chryseobacterium indoltheticum]AZA74769.1 hypothetical protein EG358_13790 [Chryseobacterium indoltheticum]SIQ35956.1 hypothetical protein SAMN05421682_104210 [Chryseobacterium indoltheticum]SUX45996.1 Uncharacterised protein [Chryseobacterium indoltheticum]